MFGPAGKPVDRLTAERVAFSAETWSSRSSSECRSSPRARTPRSRRPRAVRSASSRRVRSTSERRQAGGPAGASGQQSGVTDPEEIVWHRPACAGRSVLPGQVFDLPDPRLTVIEHRMLKLRCTCGHLTRATRARESHGADPVRSRRPRDGRVPAGAAALPTVRARTPPATLDAVLRNGPASSSPRSATTPWHCCSKSPSHTSRVRHPGRRVPALGPRRVHQQADRVPRARQARARRDGRGRRAGALHRHPRRRCLHLLPASVIHCGSAVGD